MFVRISTQLNCTESELWAQIGQQESLKFVASPILTFTPLNEASNHEWETGRDYSFKLYFFKFIPLGIHTIHIVEIDKNQNIISSQEKGVLTPVWNHKISFKKIAPNTLNYRDEIEIRAGWLTPFIALFAHMFYRHRQRRWKVLLKNKRI